MTARVELVSGRRALVNETLNLVLREEGRALLVGEPGIGKTTIFEAALEESRQRGYRVLQARGIRGETAQAFHGLVDMFNGIDINELELADVHTEAIDVAIARRAPTGTLSPMLLRVAVCAAFGALQGRHPLLLAIDDLGWLDDETLGLVRYLAGRPHSAGNTFSLLATQRLESVLTGEQDRIESVFRPAELVHVTPLSPPDLSDLMRTEHSHPVSTAFLEFVAERTGGNPLWALELANGADVLQDSARVPASLSDVLRDRIQALSDGERRAAAVIAVMGDAHRGEAIAVLDDRADLIVAATRAGIVREVDGRVIAAHPLIAAAILDLLSPSELMDIHGRIARASSNANQRAHHLDLSVEAGPNPVIAGLLEKCAQVAREMGAVPIAIDRLERSIHRTDRASAFLPARQIALAELFYVSGDFDRAATVLSVVRLSELPATVLDRALPLTVDSIALSLGHEAALDRVLQAAAEVDAADVDAAEPVRRILFKAYIAEFSTDGDPSGPQQTPVQRTQASLDALRAATEGIDVPVTLHRALGTLLGAKVQQGEGIDESILAQMRKLETGLTLLAVNDAATARVGIYSYAVESPVDSTRALCEAYDEAISRGQDVVAALFAANSAIADLMNGDAESAAEWMRRFDAVDSWKGRPPPPSVVAARGLTLLLAGEYDALLPLVSDPPIAGSHMQGRVTRNALRGLVAMRRGEWADAVTLLSQARTESEAAGIREPGRRLWIDVDLAQALVKVGDHAGAIDIARAITAIPSAADRPILRSMSLRVMATVDRLEGRLDDAVAHAKEATLLATSGFRDEDAHAALEYARALMAQRKNREATKVLRSIRATPIADIAIVRAIDGELGNFDDPLTPRERTIAKAVADGSSNREIAETLFIGVRTVETHVSSAYRKMGVRSRTQLAAALNRSTSDSEPTTFS